MIVHIDDPDDPRIGPFRDIRERDLTRTDSFIAEGTVVVDRLIASTRFSPVSLLVLENRLDGIAGLLSRLPGDVPVNVVSRAVIDAIAGFPMHRGVLAVGERRETLTPSELARGSLANGKPLLCAVGIANHDNVGALFRNAAAFGAGAVLLDETSCHPLYRKAIRVSVGTVLTLPFARGGTGCGLLDAVETAGFEAVALTPSARDTAATLSARGPVALFVGAEGMGLDPSLIARMRAVRINHDPSVDSLNVATAAAIVLSGLYGTRRAR